MTWYDFIFSRILMTQPVNITWYLNRQNHNETGFRGIAIHYNNKPSVQFLHDVLHDISHDVRIEFTSIMMPYQEMKGGYQSIMRSCIFAVCLILSIITTSEAGKKHNHYFRFIAIHFCKSFLFVYFRKCIMRYFLF